MMIVKTEGFEDLENQLLALSEGFRTDLVLRNTMTKAVKRAMEPIATAVLTAPIPYDEKNTKHIHLRDTLRLDARVPNARDKDSAMINQTDAVIGVVSVKKSAVSLSQEFGNARVPGQPYLRQALEKNYQQAINILASELGDLIPAYAAKLAKRKV
jgi:HK97 gp10 family phage protein